MSTSLVFLLVLGLWAAYLVQQWKYRHERLVTAQVADAFQDAVRVLDRQQVPQSTGAHGQRTSPIAPRAPLSAAGAHRRVVSPSVDALRLRKLGLAASVTVALVALVATVAGVVGWYVGLAGLALVGLDIAYLRATAAAYARPARTAPALVMRDAAPQGRSFGAAPVASDDAHDVAQDVADDVAGDVSAGIDDDVIDAEATVAVPVARREEAAQAEATVAIPVERSERPRRRTPELFDIAAFEEPAPAPVEPEPLAPGTWRPTPVPAPLYTRKQQATAARKPSVAPAVAAPPVSDVMAPVDIDDDVLDAPSPYARVVNG